MILILLNRGLRRNVLPEMRAVPLSGRSGPGGGPQREQRNVNLSRALCTREFGYRSPHLRRNDCRSTTTNERAGETVWVLLLRHMIFAARFLANSMCHLHIASLRQPARRFHPNRWSWATTCGSTVRRSPAP